MQECAISGSEVPRSPQLRVLVTRMADDATIIMTALGAIMTLAAGLVGFGVWQRWPKKPPPEDSPPEEAADEEPLAPSASSKKKKKRSAKSVAEEDAARANLPEISLGTRCWHRQAKEWVTIAKVYFDDLPPYYSVTMADGSERATVRARLDTQAEREESLAADARRVAEEKAEAAAAALLAEEAKEPRRKPTSEGRGSSKAKRR